MSSHFFDLESERTVLAYALSTYESCGEAISDLPTHYLEDTRHQRIWEAAKFYYQQYGGVLDHQGLEQLLQQNNTPQDKQVMYLALLHQIKSKTADRAQFRSTLETLGSLAFKRGLFDFTNDAAGYLQSVAPLDKEKVCNELVSRLLSLQSHSGGATLRETSYKEDVGKRVELYQDRKAHPEKYKGIPYGFKKLDDLTGGVYPGEISIMFGRPATGKSMVVHNIAYNAAKEGRNSIIVTIEMPKEQIARRLDSRHLQISARGLRNATLTGPEEQSFFGLGSQGVNLPGDIFICDMPQGCSMAQILPVLRRHKMRHKIDLLLIDYLNLMQPNKWSNSKVERTADVSRELKELARLENIPVIVPARATRDVAKMDEKDDVGTEHLSWSDAIGYDADQIIYLKKGSMVSEIEGQIDVMVVKFRDGSNEKIKLGVNWDRSWMGDFDDILQSFQASTSVPSV